MVVHPSELTHLSLQWHHLEVSFSTEKYYCNINQSLKMILLNALVTSATAWQWCSSYRLCRSLVFLKVEAAELLLASALVNIAGNVDANNSICGLISTKVCWAPSYLIAWRMHPSIILNQLMSCNILVGWENNFLRLQSFN